MEKPLRVTLRQMEGVQETDQPQYQYGQHHHSDTEDVDSLILDDNASFHNVFAKDTMQGKAQPSVQHKTNPKQYQQNETRPETKGQEHKSYALPRPAMPKMDFPDFEGSDPKDKQALVITLSLAISLHSIGGFKPLAGCVRIQLILFPSVIEPVQLPGSPKSGVTPKKSGESALILIRHGESLWNEKNLFTGCVDVPLTPKGVDEAIEAGKRICNIPVDVIYTSSLIRAQMTAMLAMMQHRRMVSFKALTSKKPLIDLVKSKFMNGVAVMIFSPNGESLEMCAERAVAYFKDQIIPKLVAGKHVMIAAHGNSLRSIIMHLDKLTSQEVISLELSTGIPMLYIFKEGKFIRRGSPAGPSEAGVYAYTKNLAQYRQKLDGMVQ
ncbi:unnamed protein product [Miscanthus lutarioriparius]|uniref:phosphoglycerate mutase (2,3-diphosphoglycerate-dependent) n=1 Tax=Miscanthus lutarioriparius TaxID=422564 RepID=A0A811PM43_9POAL|nr:unnamed protein product [Miscanthus lutarioriparius]